MIKYLFTFLACFIVFHDIMAQDDLLAELEKETGGEKEYADFIFKGTRLINGHSVKTLHKGELEFLISHRFGQINSGAYELYGLDNSFIRFGLDYGITDDLTIGFGRSSYDKTYDGFVKYKILKQSTGAGGMPFTLTLLADASTKTSPDKASAPGITSKNRLAYVTSLLIARKVNSALSVQVSPTFIHKNMVYEPQKNDTYAVGAGLRYKITSSVTVNFEHFIRLNINGNDYTYEGADTFNAVALGVDIETGGHVFQLHLTNTRGMMERAIITETTGNVLKGDIHLGFNISRTFQLVK